MSLSKYSAEVAGQNRLRGERVTESLLDLILVFGDRDFLSAFDLRGRVRLVKQHRLLPLINRNRSRAAAGIGQNHEQRLAAGTSGQRREDRRYQQNPAHDYWPPST